MPYDNYIAIDWSLRTVAIAIITKNGMKAQVIEFPTDINKVKRYLKNIEGVCILTFEETTGSQWLYRELSDYVHKIIVCDPYHNHLLRRGPKTDKIDAEKLAIHLKSGYISSVFHSDDRLIELRKVVSGYEDLVKTGASWKNRHAAILRSYGKKKSEGKTAHPVGDFILAKIEFNIALYEKQKKEYKELFSYLSRNISVIRRLRTIPGIGMIGAVKIAATVVDGARFPSKFHFWSYCGLAKHELCSGGRSYGRRSGHTSKRLKAVFKAAVMSAINHNSTSPFNDYYLYQIKEKGLAPHNARHAVARKIATVALAIVKNGENFKRRKFVSKKRVLSNVL